MLNFMENPKIRTSFIPRTNEPEPSEYTKLSSKLSTLFGRFLGLSNFYYKNNTKFPYDSKANVNAQEINFIATYLHLHFFLVYFENETYTRRSVSFVAMLLLFLCKTI